MSYPSYPEHSERPRTGTSHRRTLAAILIIASASALVASRAAAQSTADEPPRLDERTAFTVEGQHLKLGLLAIDYGITDRIAIGIDPPAWAAPVVLPIWIPNAHAEVVVLERESLAVSVRAAGFYANLQTEDSSSGSLVAVPLSLFASARLAPRWWLHGEGTYIYARAFGGGGDLDNADLNGAVAQRAAQLGAVLEYKMTQVVSLTALGRYQVYAGDLVFSGSSTLDAYTTAQVEGELTSENQNPWQAIGGVALLWPAVRIVLGLGYGNYFIPGVSIAMPDRIFVPDLSISVVL